ncbi:MAG: hypothetical protein HY826_09265, partial [Actinobacteria bacterium]|nr:hypothetical protein [Actinomycetota bacterium]
MHQQVRLLAIDDAPAVAQLEREARALLQHQRGGPDLLAERSAVGDWTDHVGNIDLPTWVGTIDGSVLAYLELCVMAGAAD